MVRYVYEKAVETHELGHMGRVTGLDLSQVPDQMQKAFSSISSQILEVEPWNLEFLVMLKPDRCYTTMISRSAGSVCVLSRAGPLSPFRKLLLGVLRHSTTS